MFGLRVFSGSFVDAGFGEDHIPNPNTPPLVTKLNFPIEPVVFDRDPVTGRTVICFTGNEAQGYEIINLGTNPANAGSPVINLNDLLDGKDVSNGIIATDAVGFSEVEFATPASAERGFFQIRETPSS